VLTAVSEQVAILCSAKHVVIFSDGSGQSGGLRFDLRT
jgi:hypothetical protein